MRYLKTYKLYIESIVLDSNIEEIIDITESLSVVDDTLLTSIKAEEKEMSLVFDYLSDENKSIDSVCKDSKFIHQISKLGFRLSEVFNTDDYETFINKTIKFVLVYLKDTNDLVNPEYIITQTWNESTNKWEKVKLYKINDDIKNFYDKLSSKTVQFTKDDINYIYKTGNSGNNWILQNVDNETEDFKKEMTKDDLKKASKLQGIKITII
mgnify:CR=1 FL=1